MRQFLRGERAKLADLAAINRLWEVGVSIDAPFFIVDFVCLGLDASGQVVDDRYLISLNQPDAPRGAIRMNNTSNNGAIFSMDLGLMPPEVRRLVFTATLHAPEMPGGILGAAFSVFGVQDQIRQIGEGHLTLSTPAVDVGFFSFSGQDFGEESTLILGELYWRNEWRFVAAGQPLKGELSTFLQTLTDGPMPLPPTPAPQPAAPPMAAPPRQPRAATWPPPTPPAQSRPPITAAPSAPIARPAPAPVAPPRTAPTAPVAQPAAQSIASPPKAVTPPPAPPVLAQSLPPGGKLQDLVDDAAPGSTLTLMSDEYEGPITISKPLVLEGRGSALWARNGPIVIVSAPDVALHNLDIEITISHEATDESGVALKVENQVPRLKLDNVRVRGRISGLGAEDGDWDLPTMLNLGAFAPRADNNYSFTLRVPTPVKLSSPVEGVSLSPAEVGAGEHQITLSVQGVPPDTLLVGFVEVCSASLVRTIPLNGSATVGETPKSNQHL
jgi:stress response protein SCP2